ncbi:WecB/TagA/CpsF family glycosyltransferase [Salipiger bermudensis]|uniref:WecB/TagA/CpsF family glycosyltransferase n=1 Tax=Salipiger bermudensis TaxID=344736 RepID=UPI001C9947BE|nr:WecB/TagA/CpsF family glycosyltransferase [Salipiger bermudensis]MBY6004249.1 WecB/TagA/CpsF family glycosyltransferase [Salipiger bermudensis]
MPQPDTAAIALPPVTTSEISLLGIKVSALNLATAVNRLTQAIARDERGYVCVCGAHGVVDSQSDGALRAAINQALLVTPDGMPLVWELRRRGFQGAGRVYGPDLMLAMFEEPGLRHYLYGATPATLATLESKLGAKFAQATIVGTHAPPFRALSTEEEAEDLRRINAANPDIVWVGLGAPKQELWMARVRDRLEAPLLIGVGAAFDFHAGNTRQAPGWMQRAGLEWLFRLAVEPRRLWRRYGRIVPSYLWLLALQRSGLRRFPVPNRSVNG